jgi:hypothetical protein
MKVRVNSIYRVNRCLLDIADSRTDVSDGDIVRVINLHGCPPANTMRHCYIANPFTGDFIGMVCTSSLEPASTATKRHIRRIVNR